MLSDDSPGRAICRGRVLWQVLQSLEFCWPLDRCWLLSVHFSFGKKVYERSSETRNDVGDDRGESRVFPRSFGAQRASGNESGAGVGGSESDRTNGSGFQVWGGGDAARGKALRRLVQEKPGNDRRDRRDAAELRRRTSHCGYAAHGGPIGAGVGAGYARYAFQDVDSRPTRQFLRQDVGLQ